MHKNQARYQRSLWLCKEDHDQLTELQQQGYKVIEILRMGIATAKKILEDKENDHRLT